MDETGDDLFSRYKDFIKNRQQDSSQQKINWKCREDSFVNQQGNVVKMNFNSISKELEDSIEEFEKIKSEKVKSTSNLKRDTKAIQPLPKEFREVRESTTENEKGPRIRLWYEAQRKWLPCFPKDVDKLKQLIISMIISSKKVQLSEDDFRMYFYDYESEKWLIEMDSDLEWALSMTEKATPPHLKLCIDIRRGINSIESDEENKSIRIKSDYNDRRYLDESDDEEDSEKFYIKDFELELQDIIRDGFFYTRGAPYNKANYSSILWMYHCSDAFTLGCTGRWENIIKWILK